MEITNKDLIKEVQALAKKLGRTPKVKDFEKAPKAIYRFGSWNNFLKKAGFEPNLKINNFEDLSNDELLEIVKSELEKIRTTTHDNYNKYKSKNAPSFSYIKKRTGLNWNEMLEKINKKLNLENKTKEELIQQLTDVGKELGRTPSINDLLDKDINAYIYHYKFGSYNNALRLAGLEVNVNKTKVTHSNEELLEMYIELSKKLGRAATSKDIDEHLEYSSDVFTVRFESINKLRELAGYETINYTKKYSKKEITNKLVELYKKEDRRLTNIELNELSKNDKDFPSVSTICRYFKTTKLSEVWQEIEGTM